MEFSERLKTLRKQVKLTQAQIAEISQQAYVSWERGLKKQHRKILLRLHKYWMLQLTI
ncbi:hypothetical protein SP4011_19080 [Streptococcus parapneumoniae]|uniref:HTH cro/C1-type domain-containing protein n=1 Tax=Streptococcus parapneumoniae TaxID=2993430 RepID=A0ABM8CJ23_9STRE|nr:hypothetical protein SP4011_19080 [Streptococcus sp. SP4011]